LRHLGVWHAVCGLHPLLHRYYGALHRLLTSLFPDYHHLARGYCPLSLGFCLFSRTVASCPENHGALNFGSIPLFLFFRTPTMHIMSTVGMCITALLWMHKNFIRRRDSNPGLLFLGFFFHTGISDTVL
jgi:hypothetical protein